MQRWLFIYMGSSSWTNQLIRKRLRFRRDSRPRRIAAPSASSCRSRPPFWAFSAPAGMWRLPGFCLLQISGCGSTRLPRRRRLWSLVVILWFGFWQRGVIAWGLGGLGTSLDQWWPWWYVCMDVCVCRRNKIWGSRWWIDRDDGVEY